MPLLLLLNGPPGVGKSTVAAALAAHRPGALALDIDTVKHGLPSWPDRPEVAGLEARRLALATAGQYLAAGADVVIGQLLARPDFVDQLAALAAGVPARFLEIVLLLDVEQLRDRLASRLAAPSRPEHAVNNGLVGPDDAARLLAAVSGRVREPACGAPVDASGSVEDVVHRVEALLPPRDGRV